MANYGTVAGADTYHEARLNTVWTSSTDDDAKLAALVRASQFIDGYYRRAFPGTRTEGRDQELEWPRIDAADLEGNDIADDAVPVEINYATYEAALQELSSPGSLSPVYTGSNRIKSATVDVVSVTFADGEGNADDARPIVTLIDDILSGLLIVDVRSNTTVGFLTRG